MGDDYEALIIRRQPGPMGNEPQFSVQSSCRGQLLGKTLKYLRHTLHPLRVHLIGDYSALLQAGADDCSVGVLDYPPNVVLGYPTAHQDQSVGRGLLDYANIGTGCLLTRRRAGKRSNHRPTPGALSLWPSTTGQPGSGAQHASPKRRPGLSRRRPRPGGGASSERPPPQLGPLRRP